MTKREAFEEIASICSNTGRDDLVEVMNNEIEILNKRKEREQERAAERKVLGDETRALVKSVLKVDEAMSVVDVMKALDDDNYTPSVISARLGQLVKIGEATKQKVKTPAGQKTVYTLVG